MPQPWENKPPKKSAGTTLTPENIAWARANAKKAGRRYPNLIDNMAATRRQREQEQRGQEPPFGNRGS